MRIGYVTSHDPFTETSFSGVPYFMTQALREQGNEIEVMARRAVAQSSFGMLGRLRRKLFPKPAVTEETLAEAIQADFKRSSVDVVYAVMAANLVQYIPDDVPLVSFSDATVDLMRAYYPQSFEPRLEELERASFARADRLIFSSKWAAQSAVDHYGADVSKIRVIPFGANLNPVPHRSVAEQRRAGGTLKLLVIASHWERKGGPVAIEALQALQRKGVDVEMVLIGETCDPVPDGAEATGFLNKAIPADRQQLERLFTECHFLVMPSRAETFGAVVGEVNAYGLPVLASQTGGLKEAVVDGENGLSFDIEAGGDIYAERLLSVWQDEDGYRRLALGARDTFENRLAWSVVGRQTTEALEEAIVAHSASNCGTGIE